MKWYVILTAVMLAPPAALHASDVAAHREQILALADLTAPPTVRSRKRGQVHLTARKEANASL